MAGMIRALLPSSSYVLVATPLAAQTAEEHLALEPIRVIGSCTLAQEDLQSILPVDVITGDDLRTAGAIGNARG